MNLPSSSSRPPGRSAAGALANIGLLERELGSIEHRLWKLPVDDPDRRGLEAHKQRLLKALDEEISKQAQRRDGTEPK